ncbi:MAG: hypothetical protein K6U74_02935 [Firmicutes bacterium]|nr:hypothetical protein [Bacillota bacterium]
MSFTRHVARTALCKWLQLNGAACRLLPVESFDFSRGRFNGLILNSFKNYLVAYFMFFIAVIIFAVVSMIPLIGWLISLFAGFYLSCVSGFLFGSVYYEAQ